MSRLIRSSLPTLAVLAGLAAANPAPAAAATSQPQAQRKALSALKVRSGSAPVIVFRQSKRIPRDTPIQQAGVGSATPKGASTSRGRERAKAGVTTVDAPVVARTGREAAWLFYEDQAPYQAYQHPGRVVLVGATSGRVTVSKSLLWPPLIDGRLPEFLAGYDAYRAPKHRAFTRSWRIGASARSARATSLVTPVAAALPPLSDLVPVQAAASSGARKLAADQLAAEKSCAIRISDTLGSFYDAGPVDRTRAELGVVFNQLARLNPGFFTARYRYREGLTPGGFVSQAIAKSGCKDVLLYLGGGGYKTGDAAVNVGTSGRSDGRVDQQVVTAAAVRKILAEHAGVTFKLVIDAPYSGRFLPALQSAPNLVLFAASSGAQEGSFTALAEVQDAQGRPVSNAYNRRGHLEFTNRELQGLGCFLNSPEEVGAAAQAKADGRSSSFLAWMIARSFTLCSAGSLAEQVAGAPHPILHFPAGFPPGGGTPTVNHPPVATGSSVTTPEDTPVAITLAGTDPDGDPLTYEIINGPTKGTLSGSGANRTYTPNENANGSDSLSFSVSDGKATSVPATVSISVTPVNDAPVLTLGPGTTSFVEAGAPVAVDPGLTVADVDDATLTGATVAIGSGFAGGEDELLFTDTPAITGSFSAATGVLSLTGTASKADYQAALRSIRFRNTSSNPSAATRSVVFRVDDGRAESPSVSRPVEMVTVNDAPVLAGGGNTAAYTEDDATGVLVAPAVLVSDVDSPDLASATVQITGNLVSAEDRLVFVDQAGITGSYAQATGTLTLTGSASRAAYEAALRSVRYRNANTGDPSTATRTISLGVDDGAPLSSASNVVTSSVLVSAVNDAPTVTAGGGAVTFTEGGSPVAVDSGLVAGDVDDANLESATVSIGTGFSSSEDALAFTDTASITGSYDSSTGVLTLTGTDTVANYQAALRSVTYANGNGDDPSSATRTIAFAVSDGDLDSSPANASVTVDPVNDAPVLGGGGNTVTFEEDDTTGVIVNSGLTVADVDNANLASATVSIGVGFDAAEDRLVFADQNGITGSYDAATGVLSLTGTATKAQYQTALRSVRYRNLNTGNPSTIQRAIAFRVDDGAASSNLSNSEVNGVDINPHDDAPTLVSDVDDEPVFTEGGPDVTIAAGLGVGDVDDATLTGATVSVGAGFTSPEDGLVFTDTANITGVYDGATGVLTLSGTDTVANYQAALRSVQYRNSNGDDPSPTSRVIGFQVTDGTLASNVATTTVTVQPVNDAPQLIGAPGSVNFVEDDTTGVLVHTGVVIADVDNADIAGATVAITGGLDATDDRLVFVDQNGIAGSYDAPTGVLTLTGTATKAEYQAALHSIRYRNLDTSDPSTATRTVSFTVTDGSSANATSNTFATSVTVSAVNDAPTITAGSTSASFTEDQASPVVIDGSVSVADVDDANLEGATVAVSANFVPGEDVLGFTNQNGITGSYNGATGVLTLTGTATKAEYQAALRSVTYENSNHGNPSTATRTVGFRVNDGDANSNTATATVGVTAVNDAPVVTTSGGSAGFVEASTATPGSGPVAVDPGLLATDVDDASLSGATVSIGAGFDAAEDSLQFTNTAEISGSYASATGILTLTGTATKAQYQAALRSVTYSNSSDTPSTTGRTVAFRVSDAALTSAVANRTVTVTATDDPPAVALSGSTPSFTEAGSPVTVDDGLTVSDIDSANLASATVCICSGRVNAEDELVYTTTNGITATAYDPATGTITLTGSLPGGFDTKANFQAALRAVEYRNTNLTTPSPANRGIRFTVNDGSNDSAPATKTVGVISLNDPPVLGGGGNTVAYTEDDPATLINNAITVADADDTEIESAKVAITSNFLSSEDELSFVNASGITGSYDTGTGVLTLTGTATKAQYQAALRTVRYVNDNHTVPSSLPRTISFTANDGEEDSDPVTTTITIAQNPDAPTLTAGTGNVKTFTENGAPAVVDDGIVAADVDSTDLSGATVSITTGFSAAQGDTLAFTPTLAITGSYNPVTGVLTISGTGTKAEYQTALRSVVYSNTSENPTTSRTVSFQVRDESATASNTATHAVTILPVNDPPALAGGGALSYTENDAATAISPALTATDPDSANLSGASVAITAGLSAGQDRLSFTNTASITGSYNSSTGVLTLSGTDTVANYQAALRAVKYDNTSEDPSTAPRTITYTATDPGALSGSTTATITVIAVNDAPVGVADADATPGNTRLAYGTVVPAGQAGRAHPSVSVLTNDTDVDGPGTLTLDTAASSTTSANGGTVSWNADGSFSYDPPAGFTGTDTLTYKVADGASTPAVGTGTVSVVVSGRVWYVKNDVGTSGDGRSSQPFKTLAAADTAASAANDRIYVFKGDGTSTGLTGGFSLLAGQRLIGQAQDLQVGSDLLFDSLPADRPSISGTVAVGSGNTVTGLQISGTGGNAIEGAGGDAAGTLDDLTIGGTGGGAGISLNGTTGSWDIANTNISMGTGSAGVNLTNAGTVNFTSAGTNAIRTVNGAGLTASGTALSGVVDSTTVDASPTTGVSLTSTTGSLILDDLKLTTTGTGLVLNNANGITVRTQGGADGDIAASGAAVDVSNDAGTPATPPIVELDQVSSSGGANGLRLVGIGTGTFSANGGALSGHTDAEVNIGGASSGAISYPGTIGNGTGLSVRVNGRTGGTVSLAGNINDNNDGGGGIAMSGNSAGSTTFSGGTKTLNTGASNAVDLAFTGDHTVSFTGGGLDLDATSGRGFTATTANATGLVTVQGTGNTINTTTGTPLNVDGPDLTAGNLVFQAISSNGAVNGVNLNNTGSVGGLKVTGTGTTSSGGLITASTGPGINLANTANVALSGINVTNGQDDGIRGTGVNGFVITGNAGLVTSITGNGNAVGERGLDFTELSGVATITGATVTGNAEDNLAVVNDAASLSNFTVDGGNYGTNSTTIGNDGIRLENNGSGSLTAAIRNATFSMNRGDHVQVTTDASNSATQNVTIEDNTMRGDGNQASPTTLGGGITVNPAGSAQTTVTLDNNDIERAADTAIVLNSPLGSTATLKATVTNNHIGTVGENKSGSSTGDGIYVNGHGNSTITTLIQNNDVRSYANAFGIDIVQNDGDGAINASVLGNTIAEGDPTLALSAMRIVVGSDAADGGTSCLNIGDPSTTALKNKVFGVGVGGSPDIRFRMAGGAAGGPSTAQLPGYGGSAHDTAAVNSYLQARNNIGGTPTVSSTQFDAFSFYAPVASCPVP